MVEILNLIKMLVSWVGNTLRDVAEAKRVYVKSTTRVFEKYGFDYNSPSYDPSTFAPFFPGSPPVLCESNNITVKKKTSRLLFQTPSQKDSSLYADILAASESPTIKAVWEGLLTCIYV
jgi:hypothetical protein